MTLGIGKTKIRVFKYGPLHFQSIEPLKSFQASSPAACLNFAHMRLAMSALSVGGGIGLRVWIRPRAYIVSKKTTQDEELSAAHHDEPWFRKRLDTIEWVSLECNNVSVHTRKQFSCNAG